MCVYKYRAKKNTGNIIESIIYADSPEEARKKILEMGYSPEEVDPITMPDRRVYERLDAQLLLRYSIFKRGKPAAAGQKQGLTRNISAGGVLLHCAERLPAGAIIDLCVEVPAEENIRCLTRIIRTEPVPLSENMYESAGSFLDLSLTERARLNRYILVSKRM
jgi:c-di-GMP-binding flagellar brake protein YcgR